MIGQVFWTVLSGVTVYVAGQIFVKFVIEPIQEFRKLTGEIGHSLIYYANVYSNTRFCDDAKLHEAHNLFRRLSCELFAKTHVIPLYGVWVTLRLLPSRADIIKAGSNLIGLANGVFDKTDTACERNEERRKALEHQLKLQTGELLK